MIFMNDSSSIIIVIVEFSSMEANLSLFVVPGQQLYNRTNDSLKKLNHPVFSGHMQVRQLSLSV